MTPVFFVEADREYVRICVAGDTLTEASHPVDERMRERFADAYNRWKSGTEACPENDLSDWPAMNAKQVAEANSVNVFTVDDLAAITDANINSIGNGRILREKAIAWLKQKAGSALADENAMLRARLDALEKRPFGPAKAPSKPKRAPMPQHQRDAKSEMMKARHARMRAAEAAGGSTAPPKIQNDADYGKVPSGAVYVSPDGQMRVKR